MLNRPGMRIAVIGAGISGLVAIKTCLEDGLEPVCFEKTEDLGGLWRYTDEINLSRACVFKNTKWLTSCVSSGFSDFPIVGKEYPPHLSHEDSMKYFRDYAENFDLKQHIKFNTTVTSIIPFGEEGGVVTKWKIEYQRNEDLKRNVEVFDGVMSCTGLHWKPFIPDDIPGLENFEGEVIHTHNYRKPDVFNGKKILIIGFGTSGAEVATELTSVAQKVFMARGQGGWITSRVGPFGLPMDFVLGNRLLGRLPWCLVEKALIFYHNIMQLDHDLYGIRPKHYRYGQEFVIAVDNFAGLVSTGQLHLTPAVSHFESARVVFKDGTSEEIDGVILSTGFHTSLPLFEGDLKPVSDNGIFSCYKQTFLTDPKYQTLSFIGYLRLFGAHAPVAELQCRWYTQVIKGKVDLPSKENMEKVVSSFHETIRTNWRKNRGIYFPFLPWGGTADELAEAAGVKPNPWKYLLSDPVLTLRLLFGTYYPTDFRLQGPGRWAGAKEAINNTFSDMMSHVSPNTDNSAAVNFLHRILLVILCFLVLILVILTYLVFSYVC